MVRFHTLRLDGELNIYRAQDTRQQLLRTVAGLASQPEPQALDIDLSGVSEIDTSGVQLLLATMRYAQSQGMDTRLVRHSVAVVEAMTLLGLDGYLSNTPQGKAAVQTQAPRPSADF
ncbi:Predicted NTP binding protein (contains STAS domain) [Bordetella ansorpii]|uniref:Predicted NTP binding protein (Contains STAS domain) n=1 Tax=Bordetella ansorpii TaxID=288768 RepID=A0A157SRW0_9BORD|nr:STAS domain-containing protein [Bordetella ansorpii]SAI73220.1 Predicted NTP binding protein (contains STAS domain) [Bordetella ansorpii]